MGGRDAGYTKGGTDDTAGGGTVHGDGTDGRTVSAGEFWTGIGTGSGVDDTVVDCADEEDRGRSNNLVRAGGVGDRDEEVIGQANGRGGKSIERAGEVGEDAQGAGLIGAECHSGCDDGLLGIDIAEPDVVVGDGRLLIRRGCDVTLRHESYGLGGLNLAVSA